MSNAEAAGKSRQLRVFMCHSHGDKARVRELYGRLKGEDLEPWLDEEELLPGQVWEQEIRKAVKASDIVLVCLSKSVVSRDGFAQKEIKLALDVADEKRDGSIFVIPLRLEECQLPERLSHLHAVNYYEERGYERLMKALRQKAEELHVAVEKSQTEITGEAERKAAIEDVQEKQAETGQSLMTKREMRQLLEKYFPTEEELRTLCFDLDVNYDRLTGQSLSSKAQGLVFYLEERQRLAEIVQELQSKAEEEQKKQELNLEARQEKANLEQNIEQINNLTKQMDRAVGKMDWDKVIEVGEQLLILDSTNKRYRSRTASAYYKKALSNYNIFLENLSNASFELAINDFNRALEITPNKGLYYYMRGLSFHQAACIESDSRRFDQAIKDFDKLLQLGTNNAGFYYARGNSYWEAAVRGIAVGSFEKALIDYDKSIQINSNNKDYYYSRGLAYKALLNNAAAQQDFEKAESMGHEGAKEELEKLR